MGRQRSGSKPTTRRRAVHAARPTAELDITSFMNLMIILVPVLLVSMVFAQTSVLDLSLPALSDLGDGADTDHSIEVLIYPAALQINYPAGVAVKTLPSNGDTHDPSNGDTHDYPALTRTLQALKQQLAAKGVYKRDIRLLAEPGTDYQTLVSTMDSVRSYDALVGIEVVQAELFPQISFGDAPMPAAGMTYQQTLAGGVD